MFKVYIIYIEGTEEEEEETTEASLENKDKGVLLDDEEDKEANFTTVFIVSKAEYNIREVIQQLKEKRVIYILEV